MLSIRFRRAPPVIAQLKVLTNLQTLNLHNTQVTNAGVTELQQALPNCKIEK